MKNIIKTIITGLHHFTIGDFALYEMAIVFFTLLMVKLFPILLNGPLWVYIVLMVVSFGYLMHRIGVASKK